MVGSEIEAHVPATEEGRALLHFRSSTTFLLYIYEAITYFSPKNMPKGAFN